MTPRKESEEKSKWAFAFWIITVLYLGISAWTINRVLDNSAQVNIEFKSVRGEIVQSFKEMMDRSDEKFNRVQSKVESNRDFMEQKYSENSRQIERILIILDKKIR